jgi:hypothetical protein
MFSPQRLQSVRAFELHICGVRHHILGYGCDEGSRIAVTLLLKRGKFLGDVEAADTMQRRAAMD